MGDEDFEERYDYGNNFTGRISARSESGAMRFECSLMLTDDSGDSSIEHRRTFDTLEQARAGLKRMYEEAQGTMTIVKSGNISYLGSLVRTGDEWEPLGIDSHGEE